MQYRQLTLSLVLLVQLITEYTMAEQKRFPIQLDKKLRFSIMFMSFIHTFSAVLILGVALFFPLAKDLYDSKSDMTEIALAAERILYVDSTFWPAAFLLISVIYFHAVYTTNKLTEPLHRFQLVYQRIIQGDLTVDFDLNRGESFLEIATINEFTKQYRTRIADIQEQNHQVNSSICEILSNPEFQLSGPAKEKLEATFMQNVKLASKISFFKV